MTPAENNALDIPIIRQERPGYPFKTFDEMAGETVAKRHIIKGIFARGESSAWIAPPGGMKSALMASAAFHISSGQDWFGYRNKEAAGVVYFAIERADLVRRRLQAHGIRQGLAGLPIAVVSATIDLTKPDASKKVIPEDKYNLVNWVAKATREIFQEKRRWARPEEIAESVGVSMEEIREAQALAIQEPQSLETPSEEYGLDDNEESRTEIRENERDTARDKRRAVVFDSRAGIQTEEALRIFEICDAAIDDPDADGRDADERNLDELMADEGDDENVSDVSDEYVDEGDDVN
jgi:AAA domain/Sigma-70 region 3